MWKNSYSLVLWYLGSSLFISKKVWKNSEIFTLFIELNSLLLVMYVLCSALYLYGHPGRFTFSCITLILDETLNPSSINDKHVSCAKWDKAQQKKVWEMVISVKIHSTKVEISEIWQKWTLFGFDNFSSLSKQKATKFRSVLLDAIFFEKRIDLRS